MDEEVSNKKSIKFQIIDWFTEDTNIVDEDSGKESKKFKIIIFFIVNKMKKAKFSYYNTPMLVLHEYNLSQKSLYEL